jgi:hypothetical protein
MDRGRDPMVGEKNICECDSRLLLGVLYNTNPFKTREWTHMLQKDKQFLLQ